MKKIFILLTPFLLGACATLEPGEDNLAPVFNSILQKDFSGAIAKLEQIKGKGTGPGRKIYFWNKKENAEYYTQIQRFTGPIQTIEETWKECNEILKTWVKFDSASYFQNICLSNSEGRNSLGIAVNQIQEYSNVSLSPMLFDSNPKYLSLLKKERTENERKQNEYQMARQKRKLEEARFAKLRANPKYQKCKIRSDIISSRKMLKLWVRNIAALKKDRQASGIVTRRMEREVDKSFSMKSAYTRRIADSERELTKMSSVTVTEAECKKLLPSYGQSDADRYQ